MVEVIAQLGSLLGMSSSFLIIIKRVLLCIVCRLLSLGESLISLTLDLILKRIRLLGTNR